MSMDNLKLLGASAKADYYDPETWEVFLREGDVIDQAAADRLAVLELAEVEAALHGGGQPAGKQWKGWAKYRSAKARVVLAEPGTGEVRVKGKSAQVYFAKTPRDGQEFLNTLLALPEVRELLGGLDVKAWVFGSCETCKQQAHAVAHGLARALWAYDGALREPLTKAGYGGRKVGKDERVEDEAG